MKHICESIKGTTVYPIINSVLHDSRYFEKPDVFYPGHFLDVEGNFRKREAFIAFSMGNCLCSELFLFLTSILKNFSLGSPKAPEDIDLTPRKNGLGKLPPVYQLSFLPRWGEKEKGYSSLQRPCLQPPPVSTMNF
ncbi:PREDICTED: cytochrome P450 2B11-like [Myotis brandtii]|uniref:cytochrome P450 2B11-like n=1 Tax=Myotis brandtii TaxID=109478 RepID=UPI0007044DF8|nr:PREDICTED: cytochrome P450 2B11-like [Myotis brandtii]